MKIARGQREMLERIARAKMPVLEISLVGSGGGAIKNLRTLVARELVEMVGHPNVIGLDNEAAPAYVVTHAGRAALDA